MAKLHVEIVTPSSKIYETDAFMVSVPGINGSMGFLPGHVGLSTVLDKGVVSISDSENTKDATAKHFEISGGYVQIFDDNVTVLAEHAKSI